MDPFIEHPVISEGFHARLIIAMANQLQPQLDPRYVTSIEERVFIEGPQRRIPDVWIQKAADKGAVPTPTDASADTAVILEVEELEIRESRLEILDAYSSMKLVAVLEVLSPTNKGSGPGRDSYLAKQHEILARDCRFLEIDLLRKGRHVLSVPDWRVAELSPYDDLTCVNRWPRRNRFELYPRRLRQRLPRIKVPLAEPDPDVKLDLQAAVEQIHAEGRYSRRLRYGEPCEPALAPEDQEWAEAQLARFRSATQ
jgi:hypothetical protein